MTARKIVGKGTVSATGRDSVHVAFEVSSGQRTDIATVFSEEVDLAEVPEHTDIGMAYKLENGDVAVHVPDTTVAAYHH